MNIRKLARYFTGKLPNSTAIPVAEFINILENNLNLSYEELNKRRHNSGSVITDYIEILNFLNTQEDNPGVVGYLLKYFELPDNFICHINFSDHIIECSDSSTHGIKKISEVLDSINETDFSSFIVMPILHRMGYEEVSFKGKVNTTDYGNDFYPMKFVSPGGITHYIGVQAKAVKMTQGDTSPTGNETNKLIAELSTAFSQPHITIAGEEVRLSEMIVVNSKLINETTRKKIYNDDKLANKKIIIYDKEGMLSLIERYSISLSL